MNRFLDRLAALYAPLGQRGLLMDGQYRFAPDRPAGKGSPASAAAPVGARLRAIGVAAAPNRAQARSYNSSSRHTQRLRNA
jgi:hypothetical protein